MHVNTMKPLVSQRGCWVQTLDGGKDRAEKEGKKSQMGGKKIKSPIIGALCCCGWFSFSYWKSQRIMKSSVLRKPEY